MISRFWQPWYWGLGAVAFLLFIYNVKTLIPISKTFIISDSLRKKTDLYIAKDNTILAKNVKITQKNPDNRNDYTIELHNHDDVKKPAKDVAGITDITKVILRPKIAIIIDDLGNSLESASLFIGFPYPITLSVLPKTPHAAKIGSDAVRQGKGVMLHLPMEAKTGNDKLGEGAIFTKMNDEDIERQVEEDLLSLPMAKGVNNHMGSKASGDMRVIKAVLNVIQKRDLFIVDSWTSSASVLYTTAKSMHIPSAKRDVFLDNERDILYIKGQIKHLLGMAKKDGIAIGIGHPYPETAQALKESIEEFKNADVDFVLVEELVER